MKMGSLVTEMPHSEVSATLELLQNLGVSRKDLKSMRADQNKAMKIANLIAKCRFYEVEITLNYLAAMIKAAKFKDVDNQITVANFPSKEIKKGKFKLGIVDFVGRVRRETISRYMEDNFLEPARIEHLIAFHTSCPYDIADNSPLLALGSVWNVEYENGFAGVQHGWKRSYPRLTGRRLEIEWPKFDTEAFEINRRFLAVHKMTEISYLS
ncbi:MAG: hypothetical protein NTX00_03085 [Candidatus Parcubacteria bacterium]|nr:hypothetical protein [Candidatus Parcubacteria bacterium]